MTWTHIRDEQPTCRSVIHCHLCEGRILYGEKYLRRVGRDDAGIYSLAIHTFCESLTRDWDHLNWQTHDASDFRAMLHMSE